MLSQKVGSEGTIKRVAELVKAKDDNDTDDQVSGTVSNIARCRLYRSHHSLQLLLYLRYVVLL